MSVLRILLPTLLACWLCAPGSATALDSERRPVSFPDSGRGERVALPEDRSPEDAALAAEFARLETQWRAALAERAASDGPSAATARDIRPLEARFAPRFEELAARGSGPARLWLARHFRAARALPPGPLPPEQVAARSRILTTLIEEHASDASLLDPALFTLLEEDPDLPLDEVRGLARLLERCSRSRELQARGLLSLARRSAPFARADSDQRTAALALLDELAGRFPETRASLLGEVERWRLENLSPGRLAPDFTTYDLAGNEVRLSDYQGRVLVVSFWGMERPGAERDLALARRLCRRLWDERFTWIAISGDRDRNAVERVDSADPIGWTLAWEGGEAAPAAEAWRVARPPVLFLLDGKGVVRGIDLTGVELEIEIRALLRELREEIAAREASSGGAGDDGGGE